jgi:hypothetical protein
MAPARDSLTLLASLAAVESSVSRGRHPRCSLPYLRSMQEQTLTHSRDRESALSELRCGLRRTHKEDKLRTVTHDHEVVADFC